MDILNINAEEKLSVVRKRSERKFVPDEEKDNDYWIKRRKNNKSAQDSRKRKKFIGEAMKNHLGQLQAQNKQLKIQLYQLNEQYFMIMKQIQLINALRGTKETTLNQNTLLRPEHFLLKYYQENHARVLSDARIWNYGFSGSLTSHATNYCVDHTRNRLPHPYPLYQVCHGNNNQSSQLPYNNQFTNFLPLATGDFWTPFSERHRQHQDVSCSLGKQEEQPLWKPSTGLALNVPKIEWHGASWTKEEEAPKSQSSDDSEDSSLGESINVGDYRNDDHFSNALDLTLGSAEKNSDIFEAVSTNDALLPLESINHKDDGDSAVFFRMTEQEAWGQNSKLPCTKLPPGDKFDRIHWKTRLKTRVFEKGTVQA